MPDVHDARFLIYKDIFREACPFTKVSIVRIAPFLGLLASLEFYIWPVRVQVYTQKVAKACNGGLSKCVCNILQTGQGALLQCENATMENLTVKL